VFSCNSNNWKLAREEIFGPVLMAIPWRNEDDVIRMANDTHFGLAGFVFSKDTGRAIRIAHQLDAGWVQVNQGKGQSIGQPYGGFKQSGIGKEFSLDSMIDSYSRLKSVTVNLGS
jgi:betaine-aldehyde dehydrogenase